MRLFFVGAHAISESTGIPLKYAYLAELVILGTTLLAIQVNRQSLKVAIINTIVAWTGMTAAILTLAYAVKLMRT